MREHFKSDMEIAVSCLKIMKDLNKLVNLIHDDFGVEEEYQADLNYFYQKIEHHLKKTCGDPDHELDEAEAEALRLWMNRDQDN